MKAPLPSNEAARLNALYEYEILDTEPEQAFDDLTRLASHICGTPIALVNLVDSDRVWLKSKVGLDASEVPRDIAFCAHAIPQPNLFVIRDTQQDMRFSNNPLVTSGPQIRFYAGAPLITSENIAVGTLCTLDYVPRDLTPEQQEALEILARQVVTQLKLRRNLAVLEEALRQRQQSESALRESKEQYRRLVDLSPETIAVHSEGKFEYVNTAGAKLLGAATPEKLIGKPILDFVHPDHRETLEARVRQNQVKGKQVDISHEKFVRLNGEVIDVELTEIPVTYLGKPATQVVIRNITEAKQAKEVMLRAMVAELVKQELEKEITERKRVEKDLRTQQEFLRQIIDLNPNMIFVKDEEGKYILVNKAFADFYGTTIENIVGKSEADFNRNKTEGIEHFFQQDRIEDFFRQDRELMESLQRKSFEEPFTNATTRETRLFQSIRIPLLSPDSKARQVLGICIDITERRQAEQKLPSS